MTDELDALEKRARHACRELNILGDFNSVHAVIDSHASLRRQLANERARRETAEAHLNERLIAAGTKNLIARAEAAERQLAEKEAHITELQADWRETIRANAEEVCSLQSQLAAERERADSIAQESAETLVQAEKWEVSCGEQTRRLGTALVERDAAQAEARELREWADAMNAALDAFWNDPERPSLHRMRSETTSKICVLQEKHRTRIDAKLTEGA
jgi:chromosome segregation ATPase